MSSFLAPAARTREGDLASLHLSRNELVSVRLQYKASDNLLAGYAEGSVTNTKFGSFPHSTLIDIPWGAQVLASKVDTGTRGRLNPGVGRRQLKRKAELISNNSPAPAPSTDNEDLKAATVAASGFLHILPPTPESWTASLPHRTQVVYTPDYSYILHRLRVRPGSRILEAGSGSGSFTHAAARAVYDGKTGHTHATINGTIRSSSEQTEEKIDLDLEPTEAQHDEKSSHGPASSPLPGHVFTYEFHADRHRRIQEEMTAHNLSPIVTATHRDVYKDGFFLSSSPLADAVFLDLPAPYAALPHLTRTQPSALNPSLPVHICTFSPCIEQVQKTISHLRRHGWIDIETIEIAARRVDIRREYIGLSFEGLRGADVSAADVNEAVDQLRRVERNAALGRDKTQKDNIERNTSKTDKTELYKTGRLVSRSEPELKSHTSYLVFAVLPVQWTDEDEEKARALWPRTQDAVVVKSKKEMKKEEREKRWRKKDEPPQNQG